MVLRIFFIAGLCCLLSLPASAQPKVSATIKPLQFIAAAITDDTELLLNSVQNPHHYALRPSERRALDQAQLLLWVGPQLEAFLSGIMHELDAELITTIELADLHRLSLVGAVDPHIWLDTFNARIIARELSLKLGEWDPANGERYRQNLQAFENELDTLDKAIEQQLGKIKGQSYGVYHNAFQYFEKQFGLQHIVSFTDNEELRPGIRKLLGIRAELEQHEVNCILLEPSVNIGQLSSIIESDSMHYESFNVLGNDIAVGKNAYITLMQELADALVSCLR